MAVKVADNKKATPAAKSQNKAATTGDSRIARTEARKAKNRALNEAQAAANKAKVAELGLQPETREVSKTKMYKKGKKVEFKTITREKQLSPAELLRKHERESKKLVLEATRKRKQAEEAETLRKIAARFETASFVAVE